MQLLNAGVRLLCHNSSVLISGYHLGLQYWVQRSLRSQLLAALQQLLVQLPSPPQLLPLPAALRASDTTFPKAYFTEEAIGFPPHA